jgi:glycosyltransferase involved in cell wall biosynthesis
MARRLVAFGHKVVMITSERHGKFAGRNWRVTNETGIEVHWLPVLYDNHMSYPQRIRAFVRFAIGASLRAAAIPADVVFATSTPLTIAIPGVYASKRQKIPMVFEVRDLWPELPIAVGALKGIMIPPAYWLENFAYKHSQKIVTLSPGMRDGVIKTGFPAEKICVIPNSADITLFQVPEETGLQFRAATKWLQDNPLVLYAGTLGRINGISYLVKLAAETIKVAPKIRFLVVGDGAEWQKIESKAKKLGVYKNNFFMMHSVPKKDMPSIFSAATVAVSLFVDMPQMWANSANKFFDALASGTPVAINYQGWQADLLKTTGAGIVLPAKEINVAASRLIDFLSAPERLASAARTATKLAEIQFNRDHLTRQLETTLLEAVNDFHDQ